jgi:hypothetical protein
MLTFIFGEQSLLDDGAELHFLASKLASLERAVRDLGSSIHDGRHSVANLLERQTALNAQHRKVLTASQRFHQFCIRLVLVLAALFFATSVLSKVLADHLSGSTISLLCTGVGAAATFALESAWDMKQKRKASFDSLSLVDTRFH